MARRARWEAAAFAVALAIASLVALAIAWSGPGTYEAIAREGGFDRGTFRVPAGGAAADEVPYDLAAWIELHRGTLAYVLGSRSAVPTAPGGAPFYGEAEVSHLADVRSIFSLARAGMAAALAFEPAFLAFHYLFFPQGNFLFDPATSQLLRVYPQSYWYGVTLRVGATFIAAMAFLVLVASVASRPRGERRS